MEYRHKVEMIILMVLMIVSAVFLGVMIEGEAEDVTARVIASEVQPPDEDLERVSQDSYQDIVIKESE